MLENSRCFSSLNFKTILIYLIRLTWTDLQVFNNIMPSFCGLLWESQHIYIYKSTQSVPLSPLPRYHRCHSTRPRCPPHAWEPRGSASPGGRAWARPGRRRCPGCWCPSWGRRWAPCSLLSWSPRSWDTAARWTGGLRRGISSAAATRVSGIWRQTIINITNSLNKHKQSLLILFKQAKNTFFSVDQKIFWNADLEGKRYFLEQIKTDNDVAGILFVVSSCRHSQDFDMLYVCIIRPVWLSKSTST